MQPERFGQILARFVPITSHDIDEILHEQAASRRLFGEIAISLGLCRPEHVWKAWCRQASDKVEHVDLEAIGIDAQATAHLPRQHALRYRAIPLRLAGERLIIATTPAAFEQAAVDLPILLRCDIKFVLTDEEKLTRALARYYPPQQ
jgi:type IV pilus assembly protein PilB